MAYDYRETVIDIKVNPETGSNPMTGPGLRWGVAMLAAVVAFATPAKGFCDNCGTTYNPICAKDGQVRNAAALAVALLLLHSQISQKFRVHGKRFLLSLHRWL